MNRLDHHIIFEMVEVNSRVLDLGCGDGDLLSRLKSEKKCQVHGIEIDEEFNYLCMEKGVNVIQADIDSSLADYSDKRFDYVILNESLQEIVNAEHVIMESLRIAKEVIVGIPNFCHFSARFQVFFGGRVPITKSLPYTWYNTPNVRFLSLKDFYHFCKSKNIQVEKKRFIRAQTEAFFLPNIFAHVGIFKLKK